MNRLGQSNPSAAAPRSDVLPLLVIAAAGVGISLGLWIFARLTGGG